MLEIIGLLYYLAIFSGALLIGGSIVAIWEAIAREWE